MKEQGHILPERHAGRQFWELPESDQVVFHYQKHKLSLLKATHLYSSLNYSKFLSNEISIHDRDESIDEKLFYEKKTLTKETLAATFLGDTEIISLQFHRNNRFLAGLFSYLNTKIEDPVFETTVFKKALEFSRNIDRNISTQIENEANIFNIMRAVSG